MIRNSKFVKIIGLMLIIGLFSFALVGCGGGGEESESEEGEDQEVKGEVELLYVEWACATASTNVMKQVLEDQGYDVTMTSVSASAMWEGIAAGEGDAMTTAWLPVTHGDYLEEVEDEVDVLGVNYDVARIGLVVPEYVEIDSIEELNDNADEFDNKIIGIDPGAGIMSATEEALSEEGYNLGENFELVEGSGSTMTGALSDAIKDEEPIVVTGWEPHWKFAEWDLKFLEDPEKVYGEIEEVYTVTRQGLEEDMPEVYHILNNFHWESEDIGSVMEAEDPEKGAREWVDNNQDKVEEWLPEENGS